VGTDVLGGAHREVGAERFVEPRHERTLTRRETGLYGNVVEKQQEPVDTRVAQRLQLAQQHRPVRVRLVVDVESGRDREAETDAVTRAVRGQLTEAGELFALVWYPPFGAVPRVVLRRVGVRVHAVGGEKRDDFEARIV